MRTVIACCCCLTLLVALVARATAAELRTLRGKHLTLHTDLPADKRVDQLPEIFDQAVPQWGTFFGVPAKVWQNWQVVGVLMRSPESRPRFVTAGLLPKDMWDFPSGYSLGSQFWMYDQSSDYYLRHLLLHEGTHCFTAEIAKIAAPPWYNEGVAELLGTHLWDGEELRLNVIPFANDAVPKWGRIELIQQELAAGNRLSFGQVLQLGPRAHRENVAYAWSWAAAALLNHDRRFREIFEQLPPSFADKGPWQPNASKLRELEEAWQLFLADLDYGYDFERMAVTLEPGKPLSGNGQTVNVAADHSWQSTGIELTAGKTYQLTATGMVQVADGNPPWRSTADGVSVRYIRGQPLGKLFAAVRPDNFDPLREVSPLAEGIPIGSQGSITPKRTGTLYLRINDRPGSRADNAGELQVTIQPAP